MYTTFPVNHIHASIFVTKQFTGFDLIQRPTSKHTQTHFAPHFREYELSMGGKVEKEKDEPRDL